jgi:hypothetical protein
MVVGMVVGGVGTGWGGAPGLFPDLLPAEVLDLFGRSRPGTLKKELV